MKIFPKIFPQEALNAFAQGIADEVWRATGQKEQVGFAAREKPNLLRVEFSFAIGQKYSFPIFSIEQMKSAVDWGELSEEAVRKVLRDIAPAALARRIYENSIRKEFQPEVPIFIDQAGRRHHTLKAETGFLSSRGAPLTFKRTGNERQA